MDKGYKSWLISILFQEYYSERVAKIIIFFTSEIIDILKESDLHREIGIRGDYVYAIKLHQI
ncbi:hypothetical protein KPL40_17855 [Clostridium gasigenes]|uniref:hypothetical protein n=1 Tax=Clostridium gasigenes TaxID=94869 RepID=UPI001C0D1AFD|nr:hypothetical protein [Clostridium gasigenes]MBU3134286.1 hypothetical protein [Clostridium gasigenes]